MTTKKKPLRAVYGKLQVLSEDRVNGRRRATVRCECGTEKKVLVDALTAGRTRSCGSVTCRGSTAADARFVPAGSAAVPLPQLRKVWRAITRLRKPATIAAQADALGVPRQTLYSVVRAVRRCGGIEDYAKRLK